MIKKRKNRGTQVDWDNIKVTIVVDKKHVNRMNPCVNLSLKTRRKRFIDLAARIWARPD